MVRVTYSIVSAYALPKMDMLAVPDFSAGAMENFGLVTYRTVALLFDDKTSSARAKQQIAYIVAHELAHQVRLVILMNLVVRKSSDNEMVG